MRRLSLAASIAVTALVSLLAFPAAAAEIKLLAGGAVRPALEVLIPEFERASGHKVVAEYGTAGGITDRVQRGDAADLAIVSPAQIDVLQKQGRIAEGSKRELAKVGIGAAVRKGAAKPDIGSAESFKRTLLAAPSIGYNDPAAGSPSGAYLAGLFERLGIATAVKAKARLFPNTGSMADALTKGEVALGLTQISEIIAAPVLDFAGPLPAEIQTSTFFAVGLVASSKEPAAAKTLAAHLASPAAKEVFKAKGLGL